MGGGPLRVIVACEVSGVVRDAFIRRGHDAVSCDLDDTESDGPHIRRDIREVDLCGYDLLIAHPPCTYLSNAAHRPIAMDGRPTAEAMSLVYFLMTAPVKRIAIENPVGRLNRLRPPDQIIHPWMFGHREQKRTCLWLKGLPPLMATLVSAERDASWYVNLSKKNRARKRSRTFTGIGEAMAVQWGAV